MMGNQKCRVLLVPFPFQGHMTPMLQLGDVLLTKGFTITVAHATYNAPDSSTRPDFDFHALPGNLSLNESPTIQEAIAFIDAVNTNYESPLHELVKLMMGREQEEAYGKLVGIVYDTLGYFAETVASYIKIPSFVLRSSSPSYLLAYLSMPRLQAEGCLPCKDSMLREQVPGLYPLRFMDLPFVGGSLKNSEAFLSVTSNFRSSSGVIWNTMDYLEHESLLQLQKHYQVPFFTLGPLHKMGRVSSTSLRQEDTTCLEWLDKQAPNSVLYVSLGSLASIDEKELAETAWGLANSGQPFLWVVRPGSVIGSTWIELLPEGFMENVQGRGYIVKWAPQKNVLAHKTVGGFWSHCGWNSTLESLCEGVPMICKPHFTDQNVNARYLSYVWKVAVELDYKLERGGIERAIRKLMVDKEGSEMRERAKEMKEKITACICEGGSSYNSLDELKKFLVTKSNE